MPVEIHSPPSPLLDDNSNQSPVDEIRAVREAIAARFNNDINRVADDAIAVAAQVNREQRLIGQ